jgi:hypothetical protein
MFDIPFESWIKAAGMMLVIVSIIANVYLFLSNRSLKRDYASHVGYSQRVTDSLTIANSQHVREKARLEIEGTKEVDAVRIKFLQRIEDFSYLTKDLADADTDTRQREDLLLCHAYAEFLLTQADINFHIELEHFQKRLYEKLNTFYTTRDRLPPALSQVDRDEMYKKSIILHEQSVQYQEKTLDFQQKITETYAVIAESLKTIAENKKG